MLLGWICAGYPVHAEACASAVFSVARQWSPMLFFAPRTPLKTHARSHTPFGHARGYTRQSHKHGQLEDCVSSRRWVHARRRRRRLTPPTFPLPLHAHSWRGVKLKGVNLRERVFAHCRLVVIASRHSTSSPVRLALHNHQLFLGNLAAAV